MAKVSVIIPCYNQGQYVDEAVDSVLAQTFQDFEIIIVNDGSTEEFTINKLKNYNKAKTRVIHTSNQGLAATRNNGIRASNGEYILPLDADDKIANTYLKKAVKILDGNTNTGIVYCEAEFFGEKSGKWTLPSFDIHEFLSVNQIFCTALFRKIDYNKTNGFNSSMIYGFEDWDFWLSMIENGVGVYKIPETLFYYRVLNNSMVRKLNNEQYNSMLNIVFRNHPILYAKNYHNPTKIKTLGFKITIKAWFYYLIYNFPINKNSYILISSLLNIGIRQKIVNDYPEISHDNPLWNSFKYILKKKLQCLKFQ